MDVLHYLFNVEKGTLRNGRCPCNDSEQCKALVKLFQQIKDIRGGYSSFPSKMGESDNRKPMALRNQFRFDRCVHLLNVRDESTVENINNQERGKNVEEPVATRTSDAAKKLEPKKSTNYIANRHYHPQVISKMMFIQKDKQLHRRWFSKSLTEDFVRNNLGGEIGSGYTANDV